MGNLKEAVNFERQRISQEKSRNEIINWFDKLSLWDKYMLTGKKEKIYIKESDKIRAYEKFHEIKSA